MRCASTRRLLQLIYARKLDRRPSANNRRFRSVGCLTTARLPRHRSPFCGCEADGSCAPHRTRNSCRTQIFKPLSSKPFSEFQSLAALIFTRGIVVVTLGLPMYRGALLFVAATALCLAVSGLKFPIVREFHFAPGTTAGFEFSEENLFETIRLSGTVDCVYYRFNSTRKMHAALWYQRWEYLREYAANFSAPPVDESIVPHSA